MKTKKLCKNGHTFYKSSDCPVCPICEKEKKLGVFDSLSAPARRALENAGVKTLKQLANHSEVELLQLHGMGPSSIPKIKALLQQNGFRLKGWDLY
jgi:DNA-directed RNA polymerase alpha subunit